MWGPGRQQGALDRRGRQRARQRPRQLSGCGTELPIRDVRSHGEYWG